MEAGVAAAAAGGAAAGVAAVRGWCRNEAQTMDAAAILLRHAVSQLCMYADIQALLEKCKSDPNNRRRYASLILDIDPTNQQANQYLR